MSYNKIQDFDLRLLDAGIENQSKLIYLRDIQNKALKVNNKLIFKNGATSKILTDDSGNNELVTITGNLLTNKSVTSLELIANNSLHIKKTNDLLDVNDLFRFSKNSSNLEITSFANSSLNRKVKISSKGQVLFTQDSSKAFYSSEIRGQFINDSLGNQILTGSNGINISVKEKEGKKYFEIDYSSKKEQNSNKKLAYKTILKWNGIDTNSDKDPSNRYAFLVQSGPSGSPGPDGPANIWDTALNEKISKKTRLKLRINKDYENWAVGKHFIYIDTSDINNNNILHPVINGLPEVSRYEMIIDISQPDQQNDRQWKTGDELYFYLNLQSIGSTSNEEAGGIFIDSAKIATNPEYKSGTTRTKNDLSTNNVLKLNQHQKRDGDTPSISYYSFNTAALSMSFFTPTSFEDAVAGDIILLNFVGNSTKVLTIYHTSATTTAVRLPTDGQKVCLKFNGNAWVSTSNEYDTHLATINYNLNPVYSRYQYILIMPQNHRFFIDNNVANVTKLQNSFVLKRAVDTYDSVWFNNGFMSGTAINSDFNFIGKQKLQTISNSENCVIFNPSHSQSSFSLRFLGSTDPSRPGVGTWIIR